ncbi:MAG TPA: ABC transporter ATP-binding protein [Candidatus Limnocylindrales bacterium]|nr:ABC transporter ATP-binding protein [Candidatus Limnocylindrales bacterium]
MTAPSSRPIRKRIGRPRPGAEGDPSGAAVATTRAARPRSAGDDRPRAPIRTRGLTKEYGDLVAVDHLDLEVHAGEIFGLLGQNGAGKTTTILMLLGLTEPTEGQARVVGLDPARRPLEVKRRVGYLPDAVGFYGDMTGRDNLRYTARLNRIPRAEAESAIDEALEQVGLTARADSPTETYSRGMLQRLGIADALIKDPDVLILDEPTTAIDPLGVTEILDLLRALVRDRGMAILLSSHLLNQVQSVCDRIGIFAAGKLIGQGTMSDLAARFGDDTAHVEAEFQTDDEAGVARVREVLAAIPGVVDVTAPRRASEPWIASVQPAGDETRVRRSILAAAASTGLDLTSVRSVAPSLEEIYRRAVERAAHGHARDVR